MVNVDPEFIKNHDTHSTNQGGIPFGDGVCQGTYLRKLLKRVGASELICFRCGGKIEEGARVHTNSGHSKGGKPHVLRIYHLRCYEEMFI